MPIDERVIKLGNDVLSLYGKLSNGYGILGADLELHRFPRYLKELIGTECNFSEYSNKTVAVIAELMSQQAFATTSYPIFFQYKYLGRDWLLIAVLKLKEGIGLDEKTLDLSDSFFLDIHNLREAARIDVGKWKENQQPYLSFIKRGSGSDSESSRYFREAPSCLEYTDAKHNTDVAIRAVNDYCAENKVSSEHRQNIRASVFEYCQAKKDADEPVNLSTLSAIIDDQNPISFIIFVRQNKYEVNETFSPNPASYNKLQRLSRRFGTISLGFDAADLYSERINYEKEINAIIVKNPPEELVKEIQKTKGLDT